MARIIGIDINHKDPFGKYLTITLDSGEPLVLTASCADLIKSRMLEEDVRASIRFALEEYDGDVIALGSFDGTEEDFVEEVFDTFTNDIEFGNYPSEDAIQTAVLDVARDYGIRTDL